MIKTVLLLPAFLLSVITTPALSAESSSYTQAKKAAVIVLTQREGPQGNIFYGGSGVLVDSESGYILTARHNIFQRASGTPISCLMFHTLDVSRQLMPGEMQGLASDKRTSCEIVDENPKLDIALLKINTVPDKAAAAPISDKAIAIGQRVHGVLAPHQMINTYYEGYINNVMSFLNLEAAEGFEPDQLFGYTSPVAGGASGGMVLNEAGELIGITVAAIYGMNTGVAIPVDSILKQFKALSE